VNRSETTIAILPTYNEADNITPLLQRLFSTTVALDVLFVDDNSQDGTQAHIARGQKDFPGRVHVLNREKKLGLGSAYVAGMHWAMERGYEVCIQMDADHSHDPKFLPAMQEQLETADVVLGSRYVDGGSVANWSWLRRQISRFGSLYARTILGVQIYDMTGGFNIWKSQVLKAIQLDSLLSDGYAFQIEMKYRAAKAGFRLVEVPIRFEDRRAGQSKISFAILLEAIWKVWKFRRPDL
jgi:dolichol-phosphate mannosyltransferase